jgi:hypothetical protein
LKMLNFFPCGCGKIKTLQIQCFLYRTCEALKTHIHQYWNNWISKLSNVAYPRRFWQKNFIFIFIFEKILIILFNFSIIIIKLRICKFSIIGFALQTSEVKNLKLR